MPEVGAAVSFGIVVEAQAAGVERAAEWKGAEQHQAAGSVAFELEAEGASELIVVEAVAVAEIEAEALVVVGFSVAADGRTAGAEIFGWGSSAVGAGALDGLTAVAVEYAVSFGGVMKAVVSVQAAKMMPMIVAVVVLVVEVVASGVAEVGAA